MQEVGVPGARGVPSTEGRSWPWGPAGSWASILGLRILLLRACSRWWLRPHTLRSPWAADRHLRAEPAALRGHTHAPRSPHPLLQRQLAVQESVSGQWGPHLSAGQAWCRGKARLLSPVSEAFPSRPSSSLQKSGRERRHPRLSALPPVRVPTPAVFWGSYCPGCASAQYPSG